VQAAKPQENREFSHFESVFSIQNTSNCSSGMFNTHELDQTGLSYLTFLPYGKKGLNQVLFYEHKKAVPRNARYYDSDTGRFISPDPTVPDPSNTQMFNRYMFVGGNPIMFQDIDGYQESTATGNEVVDQVADTGNDVWRDDVDDFTEQQQRINEIREMTGTEDGEPALFAESIVDKNIDEKFTKDGNTYDGAGMSGSMRYEYVDEDGNYYQGTVGNVRWLGNEDDEGEPYEMPTNEGRARIIYAPDGYDYDVVDTPESNNAAHGGRRSEGCFVFGSTNNSNDDAARAI
jgi:RHS repeat-associated protein